MGASKADHERAIANTRQAIERALAAGDEQEATFLTQKTLPLLEQRLANAKQ